MSVVSVGDMARQFTSLRNGNAIKTELAELVDSLSSGKVADLTKSLDGETARFSGIRYSLTQLDGYGQIASETLQTLANMQIILGKVDSARGATAERLLLVNDTSTSAQIDEAAMASRSAFEDMVLALNTQVANRALMGGTRVDTAPLASGTEMLAQLTVAIGGAVDQATISATVDTWFDDPAGGFATLGYQGDTGALLERRVADNRTVALDARADDPAIRDVLKGAALAALANDLPGLSRETKSSLLQEAAARLYGSASDLVAVQARVGFAEAGVERALAETNAQQTTLKLAENNLALADPFETASRIQATQVQLETFFSLTARMSQLSLLRYI
ncbi:flagellar hook-associated protein 3 FlgL [Yoonia rosea]|uniref:Flagellar hook-associated protein 3 FlgL n=1 Tax=Yoonia rosea TaxID=287098 RepID=A0A1R3XCY6_9RHOB|nr:flagellin [Yoonia rosea]SIT89075.1 flagellar hook-associated protein 3 FlgL [Yoonia rosea]